MADRSLGPPLCKLHINHPEALTVCLLITSPKTDAFWWIVEIMRWLLTLTLRIESLTFQESLESIYAALTNSIARSQVLPKSYTLCECLDLVNIMKPLDFEQSHNHTGLDKEPLFHVFSSMYRK